MKTSYKEIASHPLVLGALGLVGIIALGSFLYYASATKAPQGNLGGTAASSTAQNLTATGVVEPAQNPDLAFVSAGRVVNVNVHVGQTVAEGQVLASLDTATLAAQRANAEAGYTSQAAKLASMQAGARQVDVQAKQTAVDQATVALNNTYANVAASITGSYDKALTGISSNTDTLFNSPNTPTPTLVFTTTNSQTTTDANNARAGVNLSMTTWQAALAPISNTASQGDLDAALVIAVQNLTAVRAYADKVIAALTVAVPSSSFPQTTVTATLGTVGTFRDTINAQMLGLQGTQQQIASGKVAVQAARDALNQTLAGSSAQDLEAQQAQVDAARATVAMYDAQIANAIVIAPFSGTVASVQVKPGDIVPANKTAVTLNPKGALQVAAYFTAIDITKIKTGMPATVTLDAYGSGRQFTATVASVDSAPSPTSDAPNAAEGYKATLQFDSSDPSITSGMSANITIPLSQQ